MSSLIMVIEDDADILELIEYILTNEGYAVAGYQHLASLEKIIPHQPSLILLDNKVAGGNGSELCVQLKAHTHTKHIPVVLISANNNIAEIAENCNADGFLPKPFNLDDLVNLVKRYG